MSLICQLDKVWAKVNQNCVDIVNLQNAGDLDEQTLSIVGNQLTISNGNTVALPAGTTVNPSNLQPLPDQDNATSIRTGQVGTSADYARGDHQHRVVRLANPGDPTITVAGAGTLAQSVILDRWSDEESYAYKFRVRVTNMPAGAGWTYVVVPNIGGFQRPEISGIGNYRTGSTTPQIDTDVTNNQSRFGAAPRGPRMGKEWHEWSSTQRIYNGYYRRDNAIPSDYVEFIVRYTLL